MKSLTLSLALIFCLAALPAYQNASFSLISPSRLSRGDTEFAVMHRFYGAVDEDVWQSLFGTNQGANVGFSLRYSLISDLELKTAYTGSRQRLELGGSWSTRSLDLPLAAQLDLIYASFKQPGFEERKGGFLALASLQNLELANYCILSLNAGYDGYYERIFSGFGLMIPVLDYLSLGAEYYPVWDRESATASTQAALGSSDVYLFGIKLDTYGHHFLFSLSNGYGLNPAVQSMGTGNTDLYLGFQIQRRF